MENLLSLDDTSKISLIKDLVNAGISSFKIEGRMRNEDYVYNTTKSYRECIDIIKNELQS